MLHIVSKDNIYISYLLTYLNSHNDPINGFRSATTHPFQALLLLVRIHQLVTLFLSLQQIQGRPLHSLLQIPTSNTRLGGACSLFEPTQPLGINTLHKSHVVEELIQLTIISDVEIIANSHWTEDLTQDFFSRSQSCYIGT